MRKHSRTWTFGSIAKRLLVFYGFIVACVHSRPAGVMRCFNRLITHFKNAWNQYLWAMTLRVFASRGRVSAAGPRHALVICHGTWQFQPFIFNLGTRSA